MLCYVRNNIFKRLSSKCDKCKMSSAKYALMCASTSEECYWSYLCEDCIRGLRKRKPKSLDLESRTLHFLAKQSESKTITIF